MGWTPDRAVLGSSPGWAHFDGYLGKTLQLSEFVAYHSYNVEMIIMLDVKALENDFP